MADYKKSVGFQQMTALASATAMTVPAGARIATIQAESQTVRWRDDGTSPTATVGNRIFVGDTLVYDAADLAVVKFIEEVASAKLNIHFYS